jgi:NADPH-dependent 7-cyano-7-deazaguanine reductase QueF
MLLLEGYRVSQKWRTKYLLPYRGCLNVHEKNMETIFQTKKIIFIIIINGNTM